MYLSDIKDLKSGSMVTSKVIDMLTEELIGESFVE